MVNHRRETRSKRSPTGSSLASTHVVTVVGDGQHIVRVAQYLGVRIRWWEWRRRGRRDRRDERVNDGNNYKGMMRAEDYKKRREEVLGGKELAEQKKSEAIANAVKADRAAAVEDARSREERERARKEKLQRELQQQPTDEQADDDNDGTSAAKKKKKRKRPNESAGLSFDVEDAS